MRIGINVPNELLQRVKAIRPEVNVSQICREALESRAALQQRIDDWLDDYEIEELAQHFAQADNLPLIEPDWVAMGIEDARGWIEAATPDEWESCFRVYRHLKESGNSLASLASFVIAPADTLGKTFTNASGRMKNGSIGKLIREMTALTPTRKQAKNTTTPG